jgi:hypothetical protein
MAQQVLVSMVDDLDGSEAHGTVRFGLDGKPLEIDLSAANAARLRDVLAPYIAAGAKVGRAGTRVTRHSRRGAEGWLERRAHNAVVRQWANEHGYEVGELGRIPAAVVAAYDARDQAPPTERGVALSEAPQPANGGVDPLAFSSEVRRWAQTNGHQVGERGRMSAGVVAAYRAAAGGKKSARQSTRRTPAPSFSG